MYLENIVIQNFRNIEKAELEFKSRFILVTGDNAQGKTNLLESVYYLLNARSFLDSKIESILQFDKASFWLRGTVDKSPNRFESVISWLSSTKRVMVNSKAVRSMSEYQKYFSCVHSSSAQTEEFSRGPGWRRRMLDRLVMQIEHPYIRLMGDYYKTIKSRNILLKRKAFDDALFEQYTASLVDLCSKIMGFRMKYLRLFSETYDRVFLDLFGKLLPSLRPVLLLNGSIMDESSSFYDIFSSLSSKNLADDMRTGFTTWGLSKTDFLFYLDSRPIIRYSSRGQLKLIIILLLLVQSEIIRGIESSSPVLVIDDMFGEMGDSFIETLLDYLNAFDQVFISSIKNNLGLREHDLIIMKNGNPVKG